MNLEHHFDEIKAHLKRLRKWEYDIDYQDDLEIRIIVRNKYAVKYFGVYYEDKYTRKLKDSVEERPQYCNYRLNFLQELVGTNDGFVTMVGENWYRSEKDVIKRMNQLTARYV